MHLAQVSCILLRFVVGYSICSDFHYMVCLINKQAGVSMQFNGLFKTFIPLFQTLFMLNSLTYDFMIYESHDTKNNKTIASIANVNTRLVSARDFYGLFKILFPSSTLLISEFLHSRPYDLQIA